MKHVLALMALALVAAGCAASPTPRVAAPPPAARPAPTSTAMQFYLPKPECFTTPGCIPVIHAIGDITTQTAALFEAAVAANASAFAATGGIALDSPGGNLVGGMLLGDAIRRAGLNTIAGYTYARPDGTIRTTTCLSACAWAFAGGVNRFMLADGSVGLHRFTTTTGSVADAQQINAYVNLYLDRMGIDRLVQDVASLTSADDMTYLTVADAVRFRLAYVTPKLAGTGRPRR